MIKIAIFNLADKEYGVSIEQVRQVIRMRKITPVPEASEFVEGVIALRGKVIPLINLFKKLGIEAGPLSGKNRIIITQAGSHTVGVIVDAVSGVITLDEGALSPVDEVLKEARYLIGVVRVDKRLVLIIDIEKLLGDDVKSSVEKIRQRVEVHKNIKGV
jgi:purine-binding chemotaxis protein CheW